MKDALHRRLIAAFAIVIALVATIGIAAGWFTWNTQQAFGVLYGNTVGTAELLKADSELWHLRYSISQGVNADQEALRKLVDSEKERFDNVHQALDVYAAGQLDDEERQALSELRGLLNRYAEVRPRWFQLRLEGKEDEAKAYRAKNTTPLAWTVTKAFDKQVEVHKRVAAARHDRLHAGAARLRWFVVSACVLALGVALVLAAWIVRVLTGPVARATEVARSIAQGHLTNDIPVDRGPMGHLMDALRDMQASLVRIVSAVRADAEQVAVAGTQIAHGNGDLSARTEQQAGALDETASAMRQLGHTVRSNADYAQEANRLAGSASAIAQRGGNVVAQVVDTMKGINDSSKRIADITGVIDGIAFQTNILALNAAVEAARAGEQGRGFAVVAGEVRTLAQRSAEAAREIKALIGASVDRVEQGSTLVDQAGATMQEVVDAIQRVTQIMGEISAASAEQSAGVEQVGAAVRRMDETTQRNAELVQQSAAAADTLREQAQRLVQAVAVFRLQHA